ncbi:MAG: DinB family protein [Fimbriimonadaceae bacterium]|nr:MAG: DinB family protein [Fimbriimonadaceae bacterium]
MNPYLIQVLGAGPRLMGSLCRRLPREAWDAPTHPGRFTPREVLAHLADWEPILFDRMKTAVASPGARVTAYDEGERAIEQGYKDWPADASLVSWAETRSETVAWLERLGPEQWKLSVEHPEKGAMSVYDMANMFMGHDLYHLDQIRDVVDRA